MRSIFFSCFLFAVAILLSLPNSAKCQSNVNSTGTGGIHTVQGRVYLPDGRTLNSSITVSLQSSSFPTLAVQTDQNGAFVFRSLAPGNYSVVVDLGDTYEVGREYVTIDTDVQIVSSRNLVTPKLITVPLYLQLKHRKSLLNGVVNAKLADIPKDSVKHFEKALEMLQKNSNQEALNELLQAVAIYPAFTLAYVEMGKIYLKAAKLNESIAVFRSAIKLDKNNFEANLNCGIAFLEKNQLDSAENLLKTAAEQNKAAITPHYYLGMVYIQRKKLDDAQRELESAKQLAGETRFPPIHRYLGGIYLAKNQYKLAADELEVYLKLSPNIKDAEKIRQLIAESRNKQTK